MIRKLEKQEYSAASKLSLEVYLHSGQADFNDEGLEAFKSSIFDNQYMDKLTIYGAFENQELIGIMGIKNENNHISLFFIKQTGASQERHREKAIQLYDDRQSCVGNDSQLLFLCHTFLQKSRV